ncbi:Transmembrane protein [Cyphellophora attinorum]|uniref:Transmembrane protein n=1 Tax=Cyphellophora attinorum TaxID=1664694 RepID=A0A0N0NIX8_9EURO|nr:Transmembrane protein [Phialophora attinorum]KPI36341.1 Transmembrane protein [Phialophora attinorum]
MNTESIASSLAIRGIFSPDSSDDACRSWSADDAASPLTGSLTFHKLMTYISAAAAVITILTTGTLAIGHLFIYRQPRLQRYLVRLILTAPAFAICCAIGVAVYHATPYILPWAELYEAFALIAVLTLMVNLLTPTASTGAEQLIFFARPENGGTATYVKCEFMVFQLLPVRFILTVAEIIISAAFCIGSTANHRGHLVISIISGISTALALVALLKFLKRHIKELKTRDKTIVGKLVCFKLIVAIQMIQRIVLNILSNANVLNGSSKFSYHDLNVGLGPFLTAVEVMLIGLLMIYYYWPGQFRSRQLGAEVGKGDVSQVKLGVFAAAWDVVNLMDVLKGIVRAVKAKAGSSSRTGGAKMMSPQQRFDEPPQYQYQQYQ